ncbi:MAG TPA: amidase [Angustibacter sp.]|nr:amidase [Angustibacter sp.]
MTTHRTAADIADDVRAGRLAPEDVIRSALERIARHDSALGAFQVVRGERALAEARAVAERPDLGELPLAGVPIAVKDNVPVAGEPMRVGSLATPELPQAEDHPVVQRIRGAGAVVVGLTRTPELCVFGATDSAFGITRNPWAPDRTAGGSSGGTAAAVAAGLVPLGHGNDGMGSIRIPAACCGLVGIKPGTGVVPAGIGENDWFAMAENGPLATTVNDVALLLSVMAARPGLADVEETQSPLRIAVSTTSPVTGVRPDRHHVSAVEQMVARLAGAGHRVRRADPPYPVNPLPVLSRWFAGTSLDAEGLDRSRLDPAVRRHAAWGDLVRRRGFVRPEQRAAFRTQLADFFAGADVLVTPVLATPPLAAARWGRRRWPRVFAANVRYAPYAAPWNFAGYPAMSVPAGVHPRTGTPLAVQLVGPDGAEPLLLAVAAQLERLAPWARTAPGY